jgi:endoglucanase
MKVPMKKCKHVLATIAWTALAFSTGCRAQSWPLWQAYQSKFLNADGRVIDYTAQSRTTSEGQSYALFFALVANDRPAFDKVLTWTQNNLAQGDLTAHLPAWEWGKTSSGQWKTIDPNPASDADLWISYTLLQAGRLWHDPHYTALGTVMARRIAREEVASLPGLGPMLLPGPTGFHPNSATWLLNPSYMPLPVVEGMAHADPGGPWAGMAAAIPDMVKGASPAGFAMDWVSYSQTHGFQPDILPTAPKGTVPMGSYDAIRVYLWTGMANPSTPGAKLTLQALSGMAAYLKSHTLPPEKVNPQGKVISTSAPVGFSAAVEPFLTALGDRGDLNTQQARLDAMVNPNTKLYGEPPAYYDQNLALFGEGWQQHRFGFRRDGDLWVKWKGR